MSRPKKSVDLDNAEDPKDVKKRRKQSQNKNEIEPAKIDSDNLDEDTDDDLIGKLKNADYKSIALKHVLPLSCVLMLGIVGGCAVGSSSNQQVDTQPQVKGVSEIKGSYKILDRVESNKDSQISSLKSQLEAMRPSSSASGDMVPAQILGLSSIHSADQKVLDSYFSILVAVDPLASQNQLITVNKTLESYYSNEALSNDSFSILSGDSPAKQLSSPVKKYAKVQSSWIAGGKDKSFVYAVFVPIVSEEKETVAIYIVGMNSSNKIDSIKYVGVIDQSLNMDSIHKAIDESIQKSHIERIDFPKETVEDSSESLEDQESREDKSDNPAEKSGADESNQSSYDGVVPDGEVIRNNSRKSKTNTENSESDSSVMIPPSEKDRQKAAKEEFDRRERDGLLTDEEIADQQRKMKEFHEYIKSQNGSNGGE